MREALHLSVADTAAQTALDIVVDHLGETAEFLLDGLSLLDEHFQHAVLGALRKHEVVATHLFCRLQLAVDAAVALLDAAGVPGQVEVEQVGAVRLEIQSLARRVRGKKDAQRFARRIGVETALDFLAFGPDGLTVDGLDTLFGQVCARDGLLQHLTQIAFRADDVLGEDQHPPFVPARAVGTEVFVDPRDQVASLEVNAAAGVVRDFVHTVQEGLLPVPKRRRCGVSHGLFLRLCIDGCDLCLFLCRALFVALLGALVIRIRRLRKQIGRLGGEPTVQDALTVADALCP